MNATIAGGLSAKLGPRTGLTARIISSGGLPYTTNLFIDYDYNKSGSLGSSISTLVDQSGNGNNATQSTIANQPIVSVGANGNFGGLFGGVSSELLTPILNFAALIPSGDFTVFLVQQQPVNNAMTCSFGTSTQDMRAYLAYQNAFFFDAPGMDRITTSQPMGWNTGFHVVTLERNSNVVSIAVDGITLINGNATHPISGTSLIHIGSDASTTFFSGTNQRFLFYTESTTTVSKTSLINTYLKSLYGTP